MCENLLPGKQQYSDGFGVEPLRLRKRFEFFDVLRELSPPAPK